MAKATTTRREALRTATKPEDRPLGGRPYAARKWTGPKADPEVAAAAKAFLQAGYDDILDHLADLDWTPTSPGQIVAALCELAGFLNEVNSGEVGENAYDLQQRHHLEVLEQRCSELDGRIQSLERYVPGHGDVLGRYHFDTKIKELLQAVAR